MQFQWQFFDGLDGEKCAAGTLETVPLEIGGIKAEKIQFSDDLYQGGMPAENELKQGVFFAEFELEEEKVLPMGFGGGFFYQVFLNGKSILDRRENGNKPFFPPQADNFIVPAHCRKGKNLLTVVLKSTPREPVRLAFKLREDYQWRKTVPLIENYEALLRQEPFPKEGTPGRKYACDLVENGVLMMRNTIFSPFARNSQMGKEEVESLEREYPILYFYEKALDKILCEISGAAPGPDEIFFWHLYNMGYVIKSSEACFGLDLSHRRAAEFAPVLDFLLTTHNHGDHFCTELFNAMSALGKVSVSNFYPVSGFHRPPAELEFSGIRIKTEETDHNTRFRKFVSTYCITFPNGCTVFATGDSHNVEQLDPPVEVDIFIPHPRVGLSVPEAVDKFHPRSVLYSHMLEMGHTPPSPWYAVPYSLLEDERRRVSEKGCAVPAPLWGERLVWNNKEKRFI